MWVVLQVPSSKDLALLLARDCALCGRFRADETLRLLEGLKDLTDLDMMVSNALF